MRLLRGRGERCLAVLAALMTIAGGADMLGGSASAATAGRVALPDLRIFVPRDLISIGLDPSTGHRELRFTHITADVGPGPFEIDPAFNSRTGISTFTQRI